MKWTEFAGVMAWQNESRPSSPSITAPRQPRLGSVKVLAYWLLVVTTKCLIQCLLHGRGGICCRWVEANAGGCSALKNPLLIDFKWWNIDFCPGQGLAERPTAIYRRQGAGHPVLLASISHSDTGKMREEETRGGKRGSRKRNKSMASHLALSYMNQNRSCIICIKTVRAQAKKKKEFKKTHTCWNFPHYLPFVTADHEPNTNDSLMQTKSDYSS